MSPNHLRIRGMLITRSRNGIAIFGESDHRSVPDRIYPEDLPAVIEFMSKVLEQA